MHKQSLTTEEILTYIEKGITFEADHISNSFYIKIEEYDPYVCMAIHDGHAMRQELQKKTALSDFERWQEEDPVTGEFISSLPIVLIAKDSRYEYDLNRPEESCVYEEAWGKKVWKRKLLKKEIEASLGKHREFYKVVDALIGKLEAQFNTCLVYDIHSYNYKRYERPLPLFNIGAENIDLNKFRKYLSNWVHELSKIELPNIENTVAINDIFKGNGYLLKFITNKFKNTLVLATEIKKIYCNEENGERYPLVIQALKEQFKKAIINNAFYYAKRESTLKIIKKSKLLSSELSKNVINIDKKLYSLVRDFEILQYVNPLNLNQEKNKFFKSGFNSNPVFKYRQLNIHPYDFKRELYNIKVENIEDITIQQLYKDVIKAYGDKIDILTSIGTHQFLYNSLRYYGEPDENDIANANFLLYAIEVNHENNESIDTTEAIKFFEKQTALYGFNCKVKLSSKITSKALVNNFRQTLLIRKDAKFSEMNLNALFHHEIGVHMLTTKNSLLQPLKIFHIGLPVNDITQEGLAITSEYLSGNINIQRLRELALRVLAVQMMTRGNDFKRTFEYLVEQHKIDADKAFYLTARVFRGGGFTKDYVYLKGLKEIIQYAANGNHLDNLLIGKTSINYIHTINELIDRKILLPPKYKTIPFYNPFTENHILNYLISCIK